MIGTVKNQRNIGHHRHIRIAADGWPEFGLLRCDQIIVPGGILPFSRAHFWALVKEHGIPAVKLSPRVTAFWVHDLRLAFFGNANAPTTGAAIGSQVSNAHPASVPGEPTPSSKFEHQLVPQQQDDR